MWLILSIAFLFISEILLNVYSIFFRSFSQINCTFIYNIFLGIKYIFSLHLIYIYNLHLYLLLFYIPFFISIKIHMLSFSKNVCLLIFYGANKVIILNFLALLTIDIKSIKL